MATRDLPSTVGLRVTVPGDAALPHPTLADPVVAVVGVVCVVDVDCVDGVAVVLVEDALPEPDPHAATTREVTTKEAPTNHLRGGRGTGPRAAIAVMAILPCPNRQLRHAPGR